MSFEGTEGAGKTTQVGRLADRLRAAGRTVVCVREPGGTALGDRVRALLKHEVGVQLAPAAELFLFAAARTQLVAESIGPALAAGAVVLCDRFADSTLAYQGYGLGLDLAALRQVNALATAGLVPDLAILLDLDPAVGFARRGGPSADDRFDRRGLEFQARVRRGYQELAAAEPARWLVVDASRAPAAIAEQAWERVRVLAD